MWTVYVWMFVLVKTERRGEFQHSQNEISSNGSFSPWEQRHESVPKLFTSYADATLQGRRLEFSSWLSSKNMKGENKSSDFYIFFYVQVHTLKQQNSFWILFLIFNKICALKRWKKIKERSFSNWNFTNWFYCYQVENSKTNKSIKVQRADLTCRFWLNIMVFISRFELLSSVLRTSSLCWFNVTINL